MIIEPPPGPNLPARGHRKRWAALLLGGYMVLFITGVLVSAPAGRASDPMLRWSTVGAWVGALGAWYGLGWRKKRQMAVALIVGSSIVPALVAPMAEGRFLTFFVGGCFAALVFSGPAALLLYGLGIGGRRAGEEPAPGRAIHPSQPQPQLQPPPRELSRDEQWIAERLRENESQRRRIESVQALMSKEARSPALEPVRARLKEATALLHDQRERYRARLWGIELLRWSDRLTPLTTAPELSSFDEAIRRLAQVAELTTDGEALRSRWQGQKETRATPEGQRCLALLDSLLERCEAIRQQILIQKATLALRGITPVDDAVESAGLTTGSVDRLGALPAPEQQLSDALAELEAEYDRLRDDHESANEIERVLGDILPGGPQR